MSPRRWTITIGTSTVTVVAGTREAAEKIAARRSARRKAGQPAAGPAAPA